jgi:hypothetical protein
VIDAIIIIVDAAHLKDDVLISPTTEF